MQKDGLDGESNCKVVGKFGPKNVVYFNNPSGFLKKKSGDDGDLQSDGVIGEFGPKCVLSNNLKRFSKTSTGNDDGNSSHMVVADEGL